MSTPSAIHQPRKIVLKIRGLKERKAIVPTNPIELIFSTTLTVSQYVEQEQEQLLQDGFSKNTQRCYQDDYSQFRDYC